MKNLKKSAFSYDFMIPGSRYPNHGILGLEIFSKSRDFEIGIIPGFIPTYKAKWSFSVRGCKNMIKNEPNRPGKHCFRDKNWQSALAKKEGQKMPSKPLLNY